MVSLFLRQPFFYFNEWTGIFIISLIIVTIVLIHLSDVSYLNTSVENKNENLFLGRILRVLKEF